MKGLISTRIVAIVTTWMIMARCVRSFHLVVVGRNSFSSGPQSKSSRINNIIQPQLTFTSWRRLYSSNDNNDDLSSSSSKKRVVFLGTPQVAADSLQTLYEHSIQPNSPYEIVGVITQPPKRRKRGKQVEQSPVGIMAQELGISMLLTPEKAKDPDFLDDLEQNVKPDLCITAAYGQYLPKRFLATPTYGTVNIHPSLLPRWRGASPVQRSLEAGDNPVGVSLLFTVSKMDAGPIISQKEQLIDENDTATIVLPLLFEIGTQLLMDAMPDLLEGKTTMETTTAQDETKIVNADMIDAGQAEFKPWQETARDMHNRLRGFSMWPGAFLYLQIGGDDNDENSNATEPTKFKILETRVLDETVDEPTNVVAPGNTKQDGLRLVCVDGSVLEINKLQPATRKPMDALSFVNGLQGKTARWVKTPVPEEASIV